MLFCCMAYSAFFGKKSVSLEELLNNTPELKFECRAKTRSEYFPPLLVQQHNDIQP